MGESRHEYVHTLKQIECPICGKKFIPAVENRWQIGSYGFETRTDDVCSYTCMRKWEREQEAKLKAKKNRKRREYDE